MSRTTDRDYLLGEQYKDASNLGARIRLHALFSTNKQGLHSWIFDQFDLPAEAAVLELGCGPGTMWRDNLDRVPSGWDITLSDFSPGMLDEAKRAVKGADRAFTFMQIDAQAIPFADESFDAVIANFMLYHVPDRDAALRAIKRVLKPDGKLYAATIGREHMRDLDLLVQRAASGAPHIGGSAIENFTVQNGAEQLAGHFSRVELRLYDDALVVTEAQPLVDYVRSSSIARTFTPEEIQRLGAICEAEIAAKGAISIRKESGLFVAAK